MKKTSKGVRVALLVACLGTLAIAAQAPAHGPTIELSHQEMKPVLLNLFAGTTVHFLNTVKMPGGHVVVDETGKIESPPMEEPGDDWHYTFESVGTYELFIRQHPRAKARIVVVPKRGSGGKSGADHEPHGSHPSN